MIAKDAVELIQVTAVKAAGAVLLRIPDDDSRAVLTVDGRHEFVELPPKRRAHQAHSLMALTDFVTNHTMEPHESSVWHNHVAVTALLADEDRRDQVQFPLRESEAFRAVNAMQGKAYKQAELVRLLRVNLSGCVDPMLLATVRSLNFTGSKQTQSEIQHDKHSLGRAVEAKVSGANALPDQFDVTCEVYGNHESGLQKFPIALDVDFETESFRLSPLNDCIQKNTQAAQDAIGEFIGEQLGEKSQIYFGAP